jgi:hypothetical protein
MISKREVKKKKGACMSAIVVKLMLRYFEVVMVELVSSGRAEGTYTSRIKRYATIPLHALSQSIATLLIGLLFQAGVRDRNIIWSRI